MSPGRNLIVYNFELESITKHISARNLLHVQVQTPHFADEKTETPRELVTALLQDKSEMRARLRSEPHLPTLK